MSRNLLFDFSINRENKIVQIIREFDADLESVWLAWTTPELLDEWWAPKPVASKTKIMDFKVGGRRFFAMVSPDGLERWIIQKYISISPKTHFKFFNTFADQNENMELPGSEWDLNFKEQNGRVTVTITIFNESLERMDRMIEFGFKEGFTMSLQQLEEFFSKRIKNL